jgi:hypothetical protein
MRRNGMYREHATEGQGIDQPLGLHIHGNNLYVLQKNVILVDHSFPLAEVPLPSVSMLVRGVHNGQASDFIKTVIMPSSLTHPLTVFLGDKLLVTFSETEWPSFIRFHNAQVDIDHRDGVSFDGANSVISIDTLGDRVLPQ